MAGSSFDLGAVIDKALDVFVVKPQETKNKIAEAQATAEQLKAEKELRDQNLEMAKLQAEQNQRQMVLFLGLAGAVILAVVLIRKGRR